MDHLITLACFLYIFFTSRQQIRLAPKIELEKKEREGIMEEEIDRSFEPVGPDVYFFPAFEPEKGKKPEHIAWNSLIPLSLGPVVGDYLVDFAPRRVISGQSNIYTIVAYKIIKKTPMTVTIFSAEVGEIILKQVETSSLAGKAYYRNRSEGRYMAPGFLRAENFHRIKDSFPKN